MENVLSDVKEAWNKILIREKKCEIYFKTAKTEQIEHYLPAFNEMTYHESLLTRRFKELTGREMTNREVEKGFENV